MKEKLLYEENLLHEIPEKRDRFTKHFQTGHRQCVAAVYPHPVHYEEDGKWKEFDNRLEVIHENGKECYGNRASSLKVRFAKDAEEDYLVILKKGGHEIRWDLKEEQNGNAKNAFNVKEENVIPAKERNESQGKERKPFCVKEKDADNEFSFSPDAKKDPRKLSHLSSEGLYEDVRPDMDISYVLDGEMLKENIILKTKEAVDQKLVFEIAHKGLEMKSMDEEETEYGLFEKDNCIFTFPKAYMFDQNEQFSMQVDMKVTAGKGKSYLELLPDKEWLLSADRAYPVTVDPVVLTAISRLNVIDVFVGETLADTSYKWGYLKVGYETDFGAMRSYLRFDTLPEIGNGSIVTGAYARLCQYGYTGPSGSQIPVYMKAVDNTSWTSSAIRWSTKPALGTEVLDCHLLGAVSSPQYVLFDVTKVVREWYKGNNYGIGLYSDESTLKQAAVNNFVKFFSVEYPIGTSPLEGTHQYPCCEIQYRNVTGLEEYQSYHEQSLGGAGMGAINDYTGNVIWSFSDLATGSGILPAAIGHIYNLSERNVKTPYGYGWRLNVMQELAESGIEYYPYVYTDGDGTKHYFYKDAQDEDKLKDEDGLGLTIIQETSSTDTLHYRIMETKEGIQYAFGSDGYLRQIKDTDGNTQTFSYENVNGTGPLRLTSITDGAGNVLYLFYGEDDYRLTGISDKSTLGASEREVTYGYDENDQLLFVYHPGDRTNKYFCNEEYKLISVKNSDNRKVTYEYANDCGVERAVRVYQVGADNVGETGVGGTTGRELTIAYENGNTTVFTEPVIIGADTEETVDRQVRCQFDTFGRPVSALLEDGRAGNWEYFTASSTDSQKHNKLLKDGRTQATVNNLLRNPSFCTATTMWTGDGWTAHKKPTSGTASIVRNANKYFECEPEYVPFWKRIGLDYIDITKSSDTELAGVSQPVSLASGTYTFSAYVSLRPVVSAVGEGEGAGLFILDSSDNIIAKSRLLTTANSSDYYGWE